MWFESNTEHVYVKIVKTCWKTNVKWTLKASPRLSYTPYGKSSPLVGHRSRASPRLATKSQRSENAQDEKPARRHDSKKAREIIHFTLFRCVNVMYFDNYPVSLRVLTGLSPEPLFLEPRLIQSETNGTTEIFFIFALREEIHIGHVRQISETGWVLLKLF